jgi:hypothetical protein
MKMTYIIIAIILAGGLIYYLSSLRLNNNSKRSIEGNDTSRKKVYRTKENSYEDLRNLAFGVTPEHLGKQLPEGIITVYGVILDWELGGGIVTLVSYHTGDASMYLSSGGGIIGGGQHENVSQAAKQFVALAQSYLDKTKKTETTSLPPINGVKFYLLTNKGVYSGEEHMQNFEDSSSGWLKLFEEGNKVISELRLTSDNNEH